MSKTIEQLAILAAQIEEATRQGENTALRVGGLFSDIVDYLATLHLNDITLGPLLTSLNNSGLLEPSDGQTLTFSIMDDKWKYSDAITQLKLSIRGIEQTVASNYRAFLQVKDELEAQVDATDQRVRSYKTEYDQSQIEYATWKSQTDTSISQFATAFTVDGRMVSMSEMVQTAYDIEQSVTNNKEFADAAFGKLFDIAGMELSDEPSASWLYQNRESITAAAYTFNPDGSIKQGSRLDVTIDGIEGRVTNAEGQVSLIKQSVDSIQLAVAGNEQDITTLNGYINGTEGNPGLLSRLGIAENKITADEAELGRHASTLVVHDNAIAAVSAKFNPDGSLANTSGLVVTSDFTELFTETYNTPGGPATQVSKIRTDLNGVTSEVSNLDGRYTVLKSTVDGIHGEVYDPDTGIGALNVSAKKVSLDITNLNGEVSTMGLKMITKDNIQTTLAEIKANVLDFDFTDVWTVSSNGNEVMRLVPSGDLYLNGVFHGRIDGTVVWGNATNLMYIEPNAGGTGASLIGKNDGKVVIDLGFENTGGSSTTENYGILKLGCGDTYSEFHSHFWKINYALGKSEIWYDHIYFDGAIFGKRMMGGLNKIIISAGSWPTRDEVFRGEVYLGDDEVLKVKTTDY